jgi:plasmid stability protein
MPTPGEVAAVLGKGRLSAPWGLCGWPIAYPEILYYDVPMSTTLTIRTDDRLRKALEARARAQGKSLSELAREILQDALEERPLGLRTGHLKGRMKLHQKQTEAWRKALRERNWRA